MSTSGCRWRFVITLPNWRYDAAGTVRPLSGSAPAAPVEESVYEQPTISAHEETFWLHGVKALLHGLRFGQHGLPLMGTGDWNDGMNRVGSEGKGESVWLGFFLFTIFYSVLPRWQNRIQQPDMALRCRKEADQLHDNLNSVGLGW